MSRPTPTLPTATARLPFGITLDDDPSSLRRLTLVLYALIAPVFVLALAFGADESVRIGAIAVVLTLIGAGALLLLARPRHEFPVQVVATQIVPVACCGIAYVATGGRGVAFLAILLAPIAWAAVLQQARVIQAGTIAVTMVVGLAVPGAPLLDRIANMVVFLATAALVGVVSAGKTEELRASRARAWADRARTEALLGAIPDVIGRVDAAGRLLELHTPAGMPKPPGPPPAIGSRILDLLPPEIQGSIEELMLATLADGALRTFQYTENASRGGRTLEFRIARSAPDELLYIRRDITEQERAAHDARFSAALVGLVDEAIVAMDLDGTVRSWSSGAERLYGWTAEEATGRPVSDLIWPADRSGPLRDWWTGAIEHGSSRDRGDRIAKDGRRVAVEVSLVHLPGPDGTPVGLIGVGRDISAQAALEAERAMILEASPVGISMVRDRRFAWVNRRMTEILGYAPGELHGLETRVLYTSDADYERVGQGGYASILSGEAFVGEVELRRKDGSTLWAQLTGRAILQPPPGLEGASIWAFEDVTGQRAHMADLAAALAEKEQSLAELHEAMANIRTLSGLLPICMYCKKIRNDAGYWQRIEKYVSDHSHAQFSHGMCPECYAERMEPIVGPLITDAPPDASPDSSLDTPAG